jgi:hypothetical protein
MQNTNTGGKRRAALWALTGLAATAVVLPATAASAVGNETGDSGIATECDGYDFGLKLDNVSAEDVPGTYTYPTDTEQDWETWQADPSATYPDIVVTFDLTTDTVSFQADPGVNRFLVKAGTATASMDYAEPETEDSLSVPINPNNDQPYGISHVTVCFDASDPPPTDPVITVTKTVDTDWTRIHEWDIDKELISGPTAVYSGNVVTGANVTYQVTQTELASKDAYSVSGTITVENSNDVPATVTSVADSLPGFTCAVDELPADTVVVDGMPLELGYECDPLATLPSGDLANTASASFTYGETGTGTASSDEMPVVFSATPDQEVDASPVLTDDKYPGVLPNTEYTVFIPASTETCTTGFTNTATLTGDDDVVLDTDYVTVQFCVSIGGRTIGFWSNNNGRTALNSGTPTLWTQVKTAYPNITLSLVSVADLQSFLTARTTNCSGDCTTMLRAQFIATALNALYITDYGTQAVRVPNNLDTEDGNVNGCATVNDLLTSVYDQYPFGTTAERIVAKTTLDTINQDKPINPFQCTL